VSCEPLAEGELAATVTFLEMLKAPGQPVPESSLSLKRIENPDPEEYRALFRLVGSKWLWFSRLIMDDGKLATIIRHPKVELYTVVDEHGRDVGMVELDFRVPGECELAFIGLIPELAGRGHGRWLLAEALRLAWREGVSRVRVHTCTLDHQAALGAYVRAGFIPYKRAIERFPDPRLLGILPLGCAPQVPVLGTVTSSDSRPDS
jgi:GNAT superfamily N-acetyltransferase